MVVHVLGFFGRIEILGLASFLKRGTYSCKFGILRFGHQSEIFGLAKKNLKYLFRCN